MNEEAPIQDDFCARNPLIRLCKTVLEWLLIIAMGVLVINVLWGVFSRILASAGILGSQSSWTEELARYLMVWVGLLGGSLAFATKAHLGLNYFVEKLHPGAQRILRIVALVVVLAFAVAVLIIGGWQLMERTLAMEQVAPALGILKGWVYLAVPLSGVFVVVFTLGQMVDALRYKVSQSGKETEAVS